MLHKEAQENAGKDLPEACVEIACHNCLADKTMLNRSVKANDDQPDEMVTATENEGSQIFEGPPNAPETVPPPILAMVESPGKSTARKEAPKKSSPKQSPKKSTPKRSPKKSTPKRSPVKTPKKIADQEHSKPTAPAEDTPARYSRSKTLGSLPSPKRARLGIMVAKLHHIYSCAGCTFSALCMHVGFPLGSGDPTKLRQGRQGRRKS